MPVYGFIADFAHYRSKLIIEIDGESHNGKGKHRDIWRTEILNKHGWVVIRFKNAEVDENIDSVIRKIQSVIDQLCQS